MRIPIYFLFGLMLSACSTINNEIENEKKFFKILTPVEWQSFQKTKTFTGSALDHQDGFIHLSLSHQWNKTWQKFFNDKECYLLEIDATKLNSEYLKIEANRAGGEQYPHYYGSISFEAILKTTSLP
ncbi:MAG: DUF952 domain-containing protein [Pseudomonadota bacterium]|jgi:uncharacterized protein (DUF952 family)|nr:DUF952 domain-containing protein [Alphaproteobacteria bacterium]